MQFFTRLTAVVAAAAPFLASAAPVSAPPANEVIPGKYIVQLKPDTDIASIAAHHNKVRSIHARNLARRGDASPSGSPVEREYGFGDFKAYSGSFDDATIEELKALPEVTRLARSDRSLLHADAFSGRYHRARFHHEDQRLSNSDGCTMGPSQYFFPYSGSHFLCLRRKCGQGYLFLRDW